MAQLSKITLTILDFPELVAIIEEAIDMVPEWEKPALVMRIAALCERAHKKCAEEGR